MSLSRVSESACRSQHAPAVPALDGVDRALLAAAGLGLCLGLLLLWHYLTMGL